MPSIPTQRTLKLFRSEGYLCQVVERYIPFSKTRLDLFGGIDIVCVKQGEPGVIGIQATSQSNIGAHVKKLLAEPRLETWLACGNRLVLIGWRKLKVKRGGKAYKWEPTIRDLTLTDYLEDKKAALK